MITTLRGIIDMEVVMRLMAEMQEMVISRSGYINMMITDARQIDSLLTTPRDYDILPQLSKGLEEKKIICENARHAFIVAHEDHLLATQLLGHIFVKFGISHEIKPFRKLLTATTWLGLPVEDYIPKKITIKKPQKVSSYLSLFGGSLSM